MASARRAATLAGLALLLAACASGQPAATVPIPSGALVVRAANTQFAPSQLSVAAGQPFSLYFDNADNFSHDIVFVAADGSRAFASNEVFNGPAQRVYQVPALAPGTYTLHCDVHPTMSGTLIVH